MTITNLHKNIAAIAFIVGCTWGVISFFQTKAEAEEQKQQTAAQMAAQDLKQSQALARVQIQIAMNRLKALNAKKSLTADEKLEADLTRDTIKQLQAELAK